MARTRKTLRLEEGSGTSGAGGWGGLDMHGIESRPKLQTKGVKKGRKRGWDLAVTAAKLIRENQKVRQGMKDKTERGWMKNIKRVTNTGTKWWRPGTRALWEIRFYQKSTVLWLQWGYFVIWWGRLVRVWMPTLGSNPLPSSPYKNGAEDYMVRLFNSANLCTIYACKTNDNATLYSANMKNSWWA